MLLGILFFLSTFFNPVFQDKKFNKENFISKIKVDVGSYNINNNEGFIKDVSSVWQTKLSVQEKNKLIEILNYIIDNNNHLDNSVYFPLLNYMVLLYDNNVTLSSNFFQIITYHEEKAELKNISILNEIKYVYNLLKDQNYTQNKLKKLFYSGGRIVFGVEKIEKIENNDFFFNDEGEKNKGEYNLIINFNNINLDVLTENDSFKITNTNLKYSDDQQVLEGNGGNINLELQVYLIGSVSLKLGSYYLDQNNVSILSSNSILLSNLSDKIDGIFEYNSKRKQNQKEKNYFSFTSNSNKINIPIDQSTKLISGISLEGKSFSTASSLGKKSKVVILTPNGSSLNFDSDNFLIDSEEVVSNDSRFSLFHGKDSLYHESTRLQYNLKSKKLILYRSKGSLKNASYFSSFFDVSINADMLDWDLSSEKFLLKNITAPNQRPVIIESSNYFSRQRVQQLTSMSGINILKIIVNYSNLKRLNEFYLNDVASHFKMKDSAFKNGLMQLWQNGFIQYDPLVGFIKLNYKIKHYYYSQINKRDYDQINFNSISPSSQNIEFDLKSKSLKINGVTDIILSEENNITIYPKEKTINLLENLDIKCVGDISVGNFDFKGADMSFEYNKFLLKLDKIDTLRIKSKNATNTLQDENYETTDTTLILNNKPKKETDMYNYLYSIDGSIFINHPKNKSARKKLPNYPYFVSDKGTGVYFDLPEEYGEEYDSTFYFTINQFRIDSLDKPQLPLFEFDGVFYSKNVFEPLSAKLITMPDKSLGFIKKLNEKGLPAYANSITVFDTIQMDSRGLSGKGYINYLTSNLYYNKIRLFPDSAKAFIDKGFVIEGFDNNNIGPFPNMEITNMEMGYYFNKVQDSVHLNMINDENYYPIKAYNDLGLMKGNISIKKTGLYGFGELEIFNSIISSNFFDFKEVLFLSEFSSFLLYADDDKKAAISGDELYIDFNLSNNEVFFQPEYEGYAAFSFPYSQIKTSITEATWDLQDQLFIMEKNEDTDLSNSFFYSTKKELDSLSFLAEKAIYDINSKELNIAGIPHIKVADSYIIPEDGYIRVFEDSQIDQLKNAEIILDTLNEYHHFYNSTVNIFSKNKYSAQGIYKYINFNKDTFDILFNSFETVQMTRNTKSFYTTLSKGAVLDEDLILIDPGFHYKGKVQLYSDTEGLIFNGEVSPSITENFTNRSWVDYSGKFLPGDDFRLVLGNKDSPPNTILYNLNNNQEMFFSFFDSNEKINADPIFVSEGDLFYDEVIEHYIIESSEKTDNIRSAGKSLSFDHNSNTIYFEGNSSLYRNNNNLKIQSSSNGSLSIDSMSMFVKSLMTLDINLKPSVKEKLALNFLNIIEQVGAPVAHSNEEQLLTSLGNLVGKEKVLEFEDELLTTGYSPIHKAAEDELIKLFLFTNIDLKWSDEYKSWYNISKLNLANIGEIEINASLNGFIEISKKPSGYSLSLFIQPAADYWCFFKYENNELIMYSSFEDFNREIFEVRRSSKDKYIWPDYGDEKVSLGFVNNFIKKYFRIDKKYSFSAPFSPFSESEVFDQISDDDDGF